MRIILFLLKCLVGIFATIGVLLVAGAAVLLLLWKDVEPLIARGVEVPDSAVLTLDLSAGVIEARPDNPLARVGFGGVPVLRETLETLEAAGRDERVRGIFARVGRGPLGLAEVQELRDAVKRFRQTGKFAVAFAESFGEAGDGTLHYTLASAFGQVWLQPSGDLDLTGLFLDSPFLRGALDKIGITPRLAQREEYKGMMNMFTDSALPEPQRRNLQRLVESWLQQIVGAVAEDRGLTPAEVRKLVDGAPYGAAEAFERGLIDELGYWDQAENSVLERAGDEAAYISLTDYAGQLDDPASDSAVVGLVYGLGPVMLDESENDPLFGRVVMGADTVAGAIRDAVDDDDVKVVVFRIDSPGGSYVASDVIWREVQRAREMEVPVIVSMSSLAASGGYFVAAPAHRIVAYPATVTGSIGVVGGKLVLTGLWDKLGIAWDGVKAGANADFWSENRDFSEAGWAQLQSSLDRTYDDFTRKVADGRDLPLEAVLDVAKGQVWTGLDAKDRGLVDELGGYGTAFALAREAAGIAPDAPVEIRIFPEQRDAVEALIEDALSGGLESPGIAALARGLARIVRALAPLVELMETLGADPRSRSLRAPDLHPVSR
jgi:protease-4